jgi:hypothetical protein
MRPSLCLILGLAAAALAAPASAAGPQEIRTDPRMPAPAPRMQDGAAPVAAPAGSSASDTASTGAAKPASAPRRALQAAQRGIDDTARIERRSTVPRPKATPRQRPVAP